MTQALASQPTRLGIGRTAAAGGGVLVVLYLVCWLSAVAGLPSGASHEYIALFTTQAPSSAGALGEGLLWSLLFGAFGGAITALFYNLFGFLSPRT